MQSVNIHEAKTHFSKLVEAAMKGEEIIIAKAGKPAAKLVPLGGTKRRGIRFGLMKGEIDISEDFDAPLPEDLQRAFEGEK
jgi:prevent-host-death family protein